MNDVIILSASGGMEIEEVALLTPHKITKTAIDPLLGLQTSYGTRYGFPYRVGLCTLEATLAYCTFPVDSL